MSLNIYKLSSAREFVQKNENIFSFLYYFMFLKFHIERIEMLSCFSRIVGPRCLLNCFLTGVSIPEGAHPVFTTAMRDMVVCVSGFQAEFKVNCIPKKK